MSASAQSEALAGRKAPKTAKPGDFDGDGRRDLAIGSPGSKIAKKNRAGLVVVRYSRTKKLQRIKAKKPVRNLAFGTSLASADFDRDGYADLAVGSNQALTVLYGSKKGLSGRAVWLKAGSRLVSGDFDGNGKADLLGVRHGRVWAYLNLGKRKINPKTAVIKGAGEAFPVAGDFTGDGKTDVAYLAQGRVKGDPWTASQNLRISLGTAKGLGAVKGTGWPAGTAGAVGDVDGDGDADLVTQAPWGGDGPGAGGIRVFPGGGKGLAAPATLTQDSPGMPGKGDPGRPGRFDGDDFGGAVAVGDVNGDGLADVAAAAPGKDIGGAREAGGVYLLFGSKQGVTTNGVQAITENTPGVPGAAQKNDLFGSGVSLADVTGDGHADLTAVAPRDGGFYLFSGGKAGLSTKGVKTFNRKQLGTSDGGLMPLRNG
ncbi:VCBS repeat-containing protein [Actinocorallia longicatena]|uniref:VCBS repeat-containing protein n=1 Tax=Actinocorallia longicatena TaxID=111803 RepID=UPI0031CFD4C5